jgi:hypothetical protein
MGQPAEQTPEEIDWRLDPNLEGFSSLAENTWGEIHRIESPSARMAEIRGLLFVVKYAFREAHQAYLRELEQARETAQIK